MTPEGKVKAQVNRALARLYYPGTTRSAVYRFMPVQNGMGAPALDYFNSINGRFVAIETKAEKNQLTERQKKTANDILTSNGLVFRISDDQDLAEAIAIICNHCGVEYGPPPTKGDPTWQQDDT